MMSFPNIPHLCSALFALLTVSFASGQSYDFFCLGQAEGLPAEGIYDLMEDHQGALLIATEGGGLARYDGKHITYWDHQSTLGADTVRTMALSADGGVWIGTDGHGLFKMKGNQFEAVAPAHLGRAEIRCLLEDIQGTLWIGTYEKGLFQLSDSTFTEIEIEEKTIRALLLRSDGTMLIGTDAGLFTQNEQGFEQLDLEAQGGQSNKVLTLYENSKHEVWVGTQKGALGLGQNEVLHPPKAIDHERVKAISEDQQGHLWFGTRVGAFEWKQTSNEVTQYTSINGLSNDRIRKLYKDRSGTLWFGTYFGGACQLKDQLTAHYNREQGFPETSITHILCAPDSALWFTTYENEVYRLPLNGAIQLIHTPSNTDVASVLSSDSTSVIFRDGYGLLLEITHGDTTFSPHIFWETRFQIDDVLKAQPQSYLLAEDHLSSRSKTLTNADFACERIITLLKAQDALYVGTSCGLFKIEIDPDGNLVLPDDMMQFLPLAGTENLKITCLTMDQSANLWIGTERDGLFRYNEKMQHYSNRYLPDARIASIALDQQQNLWVATRNGLTFIELDPSQEMILNHERFGIQDGIDAQINDLIWGPTNELWLATTKGLNRFQPEGDFINQEAPQIAISGIRLSYEPVNWQDLGFEMNGTLPANLDLAYNQNHITFDFFGIDLSGPDALIYQCFLDGFDLDWVDLNNLNTHTYPQLPPGDFTFMLRSRNSSGMWNNHPMTYSFSIEKPFYQEWWFICAFILGISSVIYSFFQYRLKRLKRAKVLLEQKVRERTEELHEEKEKSEQLLLNILPKETADELKEKGYADTRNYQNASVLFSDFKGFTNLTEQMDSDELVKMLDSAFKAFDRNCDRFGVEKIKTIGDAYMCATGIPKHDHHHAKNLVEFAKAMIAEMNTLNLQNQQKNLPTWDIRIGIHSGPLIAGVVGEEKFAYDIWGDTVNLSSRMESSGEPGRINLSESTYALIKDEYSCRSRGRIKAKNKGELEMYFLDTE